MRVVAGTAGGIPLHTPKTDLRPTMDIVKGAIFASLGEFVVDARLLDLFAGAGGLGIEALSRGARHVVMVESDRVAVASIRKNLEKTRLTGGVQEMDVFSYLDRLAAPGSFEIIIADPPYAKKPGDRDFTNELLASDSLRAALAPGGIFVLEHRPGAKLPLKDRWVLIRQKRYGATEVAMLRASGTGDLDAEGSASAAEETATSDRTLDPAGSEGIE
ncbi:MAG: RsmD family RNA methyltransferase [Chthoniobacteraceae bacterium]